jgi:ABC-type sugar transport system permease subunit
MPHSSRLTPYLYVLPLVALLAFVFGYPLVRIFEISFKLVRGIDGPWIGFRNYELILGQDLFWEWCATTVPAHGGAGHGRLVAAGVDHAL